MQGMQSLLLPGADPALAAALVLSREGLQQHQGSQPLALDLPGAFRDLAADGLPRMDSVRRLDRWGPDIRLESLVAELARPLVVEAEPSGRGVLLRHQVHTWSKAQPLAPRSGRAQALPVLWLTRPPRAVFERQLGLVGAWMELRAERLPEIVSQISVPLPYWAALVDLNPSTFPRTLELLHLSLAAVLSVGQQFKHLLGCPRPVDYSPDVQPVIQARRFGAFPSGHAAEAFAVAHVLDALARSARARPKAVEARALDGLTQRLQALAGRISDNRVVAGVHFPVDGAAGRVLGHTLAEYVLHRCGAPARPGRPAGWLPRAYLGDVLAPEDDEVTLGFNHAEPLDQAGAGAVALPKHHQANTGARLSAAPTPAVPGGDSLLHSLWAAASAEWAAGR